MADSKITALTSISTSTDPANDPLVIVDVSDTSMAATGTTKKVTLNQLLGASGTATLASATITGDLTAARLNVTGATVPANGVYLVAANKIAFSTNSTKRFTIDDFGNLLNSTTATQNGFLQFDNSIDGGTLGYVGNAKALISGGSTSSVGIRGESSVQFAIGSNLAMTLNSTGLGVGVTPAAGDGSGAFKAYGTGSLTANSRVGLDVRELVSGNQAGIILGAMTTENTAVIGSRTGSGNIAFQTYNGSWGERMRIDYTGNVGIGVASPTYRLQAAVLSGANRNIFAAQIAGASNGFEILWNHATTTTRVIINAIPTSAAGLASGTLWNDAGTIKIA